MSLGDYEFVSIQGTGQIFTYKYKIVGGSQVLVGTPYGTSCTDPSGMVIATIAGKNVMAVVCYDSGSLLTLRVHADGSLTPLGSVSGLATPYPGIVLDGTNVLVPLFTRGGLSNGGVAKVSIASPASPAVQGIVTLASPAPGEVVNAGYLVVANGYIYVTAGSESNPLDSSSTIQVVNEQMMELVGSPLTVPHSPQQIAAENNVAYVTLFDTGQLESIDISNQASLKPLGMTSLATPTQTCHPIPVAVRDTFIYIGCFSEGVIDRLDIRNPAQLQMVPSAIGIPFPQRFVFAKDYLLVTDAMIGGNFYQIGLGRF